MKRLFFMVLLYGVRHFDCQEYSYQDNRKDHSKLQKINRHIRNDNIDSLAAELTDYKNRLGYTYYQCKALIGNRESSPKQMSFLDSAFMRGMTPLCINKQLEKFDTAQVNNSFRRNYLRAYDARLVYIIDSLHAKDQQYRQQMNFWYSQAGHSRRKEQALDSLWILQKRTDSTNLVKLDQIIDKYGWPGANKVGERYCTRPAPDVTIMLIHLGNRRREYQLTTLKTVMELCKKQQESWQNASNLIFGLHTKFSREFSEFSFLKIEGNNIARTESFFSVYHMAEILISFASKDKIEIKCSQKSLFEDIKDFMISMNGLVPNSERTPSANNLDHSSFLFTESRETGVDRIMYRFVKED